MKNQFNFIFALILLIAVLCGCSFKYDPAEGSKKANPTAGKTLPKNLTTGKKPSDERTEPSEESETTNDKDDSHAEDIENLAGEWVWTRTGSSTVSSSGVYAGSSGSRFTYEFSPDGTAKFTGLMNVMQGGCNMQIFRNAEGQASLSGEQLTIEWQPETFTRDDSCSSSQNYTKTMPARTEKSTVKFKNDGGREQLCMTEKEETCFSRAE